MSGPSNPKDFISIADWSRDAIEAMLARASELKAQRKRREPSRALQNRSVLLYFEKPSLRTLVSFEIGVAELGGHPVYLPPSQFESWFVSLAHGGEQIRATVDAATAAFGETVG